MWGFMRVLVIAGVFCMFCGILLSSTSSPWPPAEPQEDRLAGVKRLAAIVGQEIPEELQETLQEAALQQSESPLTRASARRLNNGLFRTIRIKVSRLRDANRKIQTAQCVGAIYDMLNFIGYVGMSIDGLTLEGLCPDEQGVYDCSASAVLLANRLLNFMVAAAQVPILCLPPKEAAKIPEEVNCLIGITTFFATTSQITTAGLAAKSACDIETDAEKYIPGVAEFKEKFKARLLQVQTAINKSVPLALRRAVHGKQAVLPATWRDLSDQLEEIITGPDEARKNQIGECAMIVMQVINDLPYNGVDIWAVTEDCTKAKIKERISEKDPDFQFKNKNLQETEEACIGGGLAIVSNIVNLATDVAVILSICPGPKHQYKKAPCTSIATDISSATFGLGAWATTASQNCPTASSAEAAADAGGTLPLTSLK